MNARALVLRVCLATITLALFAACDDPGAAIVIMDTQASRDVDKHVVVEVDLEAHENLGGNVGTYCVRVTIGTDAPSFYCNADLEDGDTKTLRFASTRTDIAEGAPINVLVRHARRDVGRDLVAPP